MGKQLGCLVLSKKTKKITHLPAPRTFPDQLTVSRSFNLKQKQLFVASRGVTSGTILSRRRDFSEVCEEVAVFPRITPTVAFGLWIKNLFKRRKKKTEYKLSCTIIENNQTAVTVGTTNTPNNNSYD